MEMDMRLIDSFMPLIGYVVLMQENAASTQPAFLQVKADIQRLLSQSEGCVKKGLCTSDDYDQARFIVCAWVDEVLLGSNWNEKNQWQREQLQRLYYNTTDAGVEAFERLNLLGFHQKDVREVYYFCLSLGFRGRFINQGDEFLLEKLRSSNLKILTSNPAGTPVDDRGELFPEAYPNQAAELEPQPKSRFSIAIIAALVGPLLLFCVLYLIFFFTLGSVASKLI
jgi:type VI secretion system protein ImpK